MGYAKSKKTLEAVKDIFNVMLSVHGETRVQFPTKTPVKLANKLFDAFKYVENLDPTHDSYIYMKLKEAYKIRVKSDRIVFELRNPVEYENPILELAKARIPESNLTLVGLTTPIQIVGACIKHKCSIKFPDFLVSAESFAQLKKWADKNDYTFMEESPLTMTKYERPATGKEINQLEQG